MAFFRRIHCHFCGARSGYSKSSGVRDFQCASCEAVNFLDEKGSIIDTPASVVAQQQQQQQPQEVQTFQTFTRQPSEKHHPQPKLTFCNTCLHNQRVYMETLSNYLPDEDHPQYKQFEAGLPKFKQELEQRYPQICKKCVPSAQEKINRADYYAGIQNIGRMVELNQARMMGSTGRARDSWLKWSLRLLLTFSGVVVHASLLTQIAWHAYGIFNTGAIITVSNQTQTAEFAFDPSPRDCAQHALGLRFDSSCYQLFASFLPRALCISLMMLWYNPGMRDWYHHTRRIEAITGQREYFCTQLIMLVVRTVAYLQLSNVDVTKSLTIQQLMAAHGFMIVFMLLIQWVSERTIKAVPWRLKLKMTPKPHELDILGSSAGPEDEEYQPQASSLPPSRLFARDRAAPFPICGLAHTQQSSMNVSPGAPPPSPPDSISDIDDNDVMEVDWQPSLQSRMPGATPDRTYRPHYVETKRKPLEPRSTYNYGSTQPAGWAAIRDETFRIQANVEAEAERKRNEAEERAKLQYKPPVEPSPFRGRLPQAPMSVERRLRNPPTQVSFKKTPLSKQHDFMNQVRSGFEGGKMFAREKQEEPKKQHAHFLAHDDEDEEFSPAKYRTQGTLELRGSTWKLPTDVAQATGLEELLAGNSFRIADEPAISPPSPRRLKVDHGTLLKLVFGVVLPIAIVIAGWSVKEMRRTVCLWLVARLQDMGY